MAKIIRLRDRSQIEEEASHWVAYFDGGRVSADKTRQFQLWVTQSPLHEEAFERLSKVWYELDHLGLAKETLCKARHDKQENRTSRAKKVRGKRRRYLAAASLALLFSMGIFTQEEYWPHTAVLGVSDDGPVFSTRIGEHRQLTLPDGSTVQLNTATEIEVGYDDGTRLVRLLRGETFFEVQSRDPRPFIVRAGTGEVRAVGTAFSVYLAKDRVEVVVAEGQVAIVPNIGTPQPVSQSEPLEQPSNTRPVAAVRAGQSALYNEEAAAIEDLGAEQIRRMLAWREGMLAFQGETLEEVVREVSRYTPTAIRIGDPAIGKLRIGGYFQTGETEDLLLALERGLGINATRLPSGEIYLSRVASRPKAPSQN